MTGRTLRHNAHPESRALRGCIRKNFPGGCVTLSQGVSLLRDVGEEQDSRNAFGHTPPEQPQSPVEGGVGAGEESPQPCIRPAQQQSFPRSRSIAVLGRRPRPTPQTQTRKAPTALLMVPALVSRCFPMKLILSVGAVSLLAPTINQALWSSRWHSRTALRRCLLDLVESRISSRYTHPLIPLRERTLRNTAITSH